MDQIELELLININNTLTESITALEENYEDSWDIVITRIESCISAIHVIVENEIFQSPWFPVVLAQLENSVQALSITSENTSRRGRPTVHVPIDTLEYLISMHFSVPVIADLLSVSRATIFRRMRENGLSIAQTYSTISDDELETVVGRQLQTHPNTGYKRMRGYLINLGIRVTDQRVRQVMRLVDPVGVYNRTISNRAIVRRRYTVPYSNYMLHIDGNHKLIRWGIFVRAGIDGKSRTITYVSARGDNRADTHFEAFLKGVQKYGIPLHCRSDKGKENVLIARYMIEQRGAGRRSHICGRSVHNQRIERLWRDVFSGSLLTYYYLFSQMEEDGILDLDNPKHICILHKIFLPRINQNLETFINGWNAHPLSTERNFSPNQLWFMHRLPNECLLLPEPEPMLHDDIFLDPLEDADYLEEEDSVINPLIPDCLSEEESNFIDNINVSTDSDFFAYDIFINAVQQIG